jgi:rhodanese-related sulfurtransferase
MTLRTTRPSQFSLVNEVPPASPEQAREHFLSKLAFETDPSDVHADVEKGRADVWLLDVRSPQDYAAEHIVGAFNLHHRQMDEETTRSLPRDRTIITYCWGTGCNGSTRGAARLASLGFRVKELIGGIEYWKHEGYATESSPK